MSPLRRLLRALREERHFYLAGVAAGRLDAFATDRANLLLYVIGLVKQEKRRAKRRRKARRK